MFYDKYKQLCDTKGVSCNRAALEMGLSNATPTKWKKTGATPDGATLAKVSKYFDVPIAFLLGDVDDPTDRTKTHWAEVVYKNETPTTESGERNEDPDLYIIERARKFMPDKERQKMMELLKLSFEDYFSDSYEDDDVDE